MTNTIIQSGIWVITKKQTNIYSNITEKPNEIKH